MAALEVDEELPVYEAPPANRHTIIRMSLLTNDPNIIHLDRVAARERGFPDVIQQGPLNLGRVFQAVESWLEDPWDVRSTNLRLIGQVYPGDVLCVSGTVEEVHGEDDERFAVVAVREYKRDDDTTVIRGTVTVNV